MMPEDPSVTVSSDQPVAVAPITQILTGHALTDASTIPCLGCGDHLTIGDIVFATASRDRSQYRWSVDRLYCWGCAPTPSVTSDFTSDEATVGGRLGTRADPTGRQDRLCLTEVALRRPSFDA